MSDHANSGKSAKKSLSRRQFGAIAGVAAVAAGAPTAALAKQSSAPTKFSERAVSFAKDGGTVDGYLIHPAKGAHPAVLSWRDEAGLGVSSRNEARRLAKRGYAVLVLDRDGAEAEHIESDAKAAVAWLEAQPNIDEKLVGTPTWAMERAERLGL